MFNVITNQEYEDTDVFDCWFATVKASQCLAPNTTLYDINVNGIRSPSNGPSSQFTREAITINRQWSQFHP